MDKTRQDREKDKSLLIGFYFCNTTSLKLFYCQQEKKDFKLKDCLNCREQNFLRTFEACCASMLVTLQSLVHKL